MSEESGNAAQNTANPPVETPVEPPAAGAVAAITPAVSPLTPAELATVRELTIQANPEAVPELIGGATIAEVTASVEQAKAAYARIAERLRVPPTLGGSAPEATSPEPGTATPAVATPAAAAGGVSAAGSGGPPPVVPGGGAAVDVTATLPPTGKIAAGLRTRNGKYGQ